jgi:hypothetical protein
MDFYDSTQPSDIPDGAHACLYWDGRYAATAEQAKRFAAVRWITVLGNFRNAGACDYEAGNPVYDIPGTLRLYVQGRIGMGTRARVYCDRANLPKVRSELEGLEYVVWLATLDGDKLNKDYTPGLWGVQFGGGMTADYDTSVLYGEW